MLTNFIPVAIVAILVISVLLKKRQLRNQNLKEMQGNDEKLLRLWSVLHQEEGEK